MGRTALPGLCALGLALAGCNQAPVENKDSAALTALADRAAIETLAYRYVAHLGGQSADEFGAYYTEDAVFDVNGAVYKGKAAIVGLYSGMRARRPADQAPDANGMTHTVLTNPIIEVNGNSATGRYIWTSIHNPKDPTGVPELTEQGREYDLYAKQPDGRWLIKKRTVIADGAVPKSMLDSWKRRLDYDVAKD